MSTSNFRQPLGLGLLGAVLASMSWTLNTRPEVAPALYAPPVPTRRQRRRRNNQVKSAPSRAVLKGYYARYSHVMAEMKVHLNFKHPFSETKRRPI